MEIKIEHLIKKYKEKTVLNDLSLTLKDVQVLSLIGASGSGKSTLLRLLSGLEGADAGDIYVNGIHMTGPDRAAYRKRIGFVFQDHNLFPHLSVRENIYLVLEKVHGRSRIESKPEVDALLEQFGLTEHADKLPHQISGGQAQRASIVRALAIKPSLIMLDEPTSALDPVLTYEVLKAIQKLAEEHIDFIIVTHELGFARTVSDYILFMEEGQIVEQGDVSIFESPQTLLFQQFLDKVLSFESHEKSDIK